MIETAFVAGASGETGRQLLRILDGRVTVRALTRSSERAKADAETAIRNHNIRHTILRPGVLTGGPRTDSPTVADPGAKLWGTVSRADVARLMAAAPATDAVADRTLEVVSSPSFPRRAADNDWQLPAPTTAEIDVRTSET